MNKDKDITGYFVGVVVFLIIVGIAGYFIWSNAQKPKAKVAKKETSQQPSSTNSNNNGAASSDTLGVSMDQSTFSGLQSNLGQESNNGSSNSGGGSGSSFEEYDKYKDNQSVLFGEIKVGEGAPAEVNKKMVVAYSGWLTDGTLFDKSQPNQPFSFVMGAHQVILGWEQGIMGMKVGGKRRLVVPPAVGYGAQGQGPIPPNAVLVFDVELLAVE